MAKKKFYDKEIDKNVNWGGDDSTDNLPVVGERVQNFIKDTFESKMGVFHYDKIGRASCRERV